MKIKISAEGSAKTEVDGVTYAVAPLWYASGFSTEGVVAAIHNLGSSSIEYIQLSDIFGSQAEMRSAFSAGFTVIGTNKAKRIAEALLESDQAEIAS